MPDLTQIASVGNGLVDILAIQRGARPAPNRHVGAHADTAADRNRGHDGSPPIARILLVDDDGCFLSLAGRVLTQHGFAVETAADLTLGLEFIKRGWPNLIVLDLRLAGGTSGLTLFRKVREAGLQARVMVLTGFPDAKSRDEANSLGAVAFHRKSPIGLVLVVEVYDALVLGLRDYIGKSGFKKVALGLSGGIDSSLVAALAVEALGATGTAGQRAPAGR